MQCQLSRQSTTEKSSTISEEMVSPTSCSGTYYDFILWI